ncbi:hypothetical protein PR202_ga19921 [Eleusine coracana subsp. coracana]|uniref:protein-serine/threonine phosphatase n=1 Tax=Eleusine coracana subsp. coracana TaxID=191504 RepID=A0AAV5CW22_ELECO|nr:hypothetical protein PR202_ga19921 [Eleusine coracana subsp. coracana]
MRELEHVTQHLDTLSALSFFAVYDGHEGDDLRYKDNALAVPDQAATAFPEVHTEERIAGTKFLVIACDGIWDCMTDQEVADCIKIYIDDVKPAAICVHLPDHCLSLLRGIAKLSRADCLAARRGR